MKLVFCLLFFSLEVMAQPCKNFKGISKNYLICSDKKLRASYSDICLKKKCLALQFLQSTALVQVEEILPILGQNTSTLLCEKLLLNVMILKDERKNEQSYCEFADGSLLDSNSIFIKYMDQKSH